MALIKADTHQPYGRVVGAHGDPPERRYQQAGLSHRPKAAGKDTSAVETRSQWLVLLGGVDPPHLLVVAAAAGFWFWHEHNASQRAAGWPSKLRW